MFLIISCESWTYLFHSFPFSFIGIVSLISLVILSYERYSTMTVYNNRGPNYRKHLLAVGGSWLYSLTWTVPPLLGWSSYGLEGAGTSCSVTWTDHSSESQAYIICLFIFCLGLPVLVMVYSYGRLLYAVKKVRYVFIVQYWETIFGCLMCLTVSFIRMFNVILWHLNHSVWFTHFILWRQIWRH